MVASLLSWLRAFMSFASGFGVVGLGLLAFAEASFFPVPPDVILIPLALQRPGLALGYAAVTTLASTLGGLFGHFLGRRAGRPLLDRFVPGATMRRVENLFACYGGWAVGVAALTPIPYKVFTVASGVFLVDRTAVAVASLAGRGLRFFLEAAVVMALGDKAMAFLGHKFELATLPVAFLAMTGWVASRRTGALRGLKERVARLGERAGAACRDCVKLLGGDGLRLTVGVGLAGFCLLVFTKVACDLHEPDLAVFDALVTGWVRTLSGLHLDSLMKAASFLGSAAFLIPAGLATALALCFLWRRASAGLVPLAALGGAWALDLVLKSAFHRSRPPGPHLVPAAGWSFPSGHSMVAVAFYGLMAYLLWRELGGSRGATVAAGILAGAALTGLSRIYLGVHYPSDVVAGFAAGGFWAACCAVGLEVLSGRNEARPGRNGKGGEHACGFWLSKMNRLLPPFSGKGSLKRVSPWTWSATAKRLWTTRYPPPTT